MSKINVIYLIGTMLLCNCTLAQGESAIYPFDVEIGGQKAKLETPSAIFARIQNPVASDAVIKADVETQMVIINAFPCDESGTALPGAAPAIILIQGGNKAPLSKTMDGKKLKPGTYVANIMANRKTARVFFRVK